MIEKAGEAAKAVVAGLTSQGPLALPLVIVNIVCLGVVGYVLYNVADRSVARDNLIAELARSCQPIIERSGK